MQEQNTEAAEILERLKTANVHNLDGEVFYNAEYNILYTHLLTVFNNERKFSLHPIISILAYEEMYERSWQKCENIVEEASKFIGRLDKLSSTKI